MTDILPLHLQYRPKEFDEVVGQYTVVKSLKRAVSEGAIHSFLLHGPTGTGKTTLARIVARKIGAEPSDISEIDAATYTGIDAFRQIAEDMVWPSFSSSGKKVVILDEAHRLSKQALDASLKIIEEPPKHAYWIFCTTEYEKIPKTLRSRCLDLKLSPAKKKDTLKCLQDIKKSENFEVPDSVLEVCVDYYDASYRLAIGNMERCLNITDPEKARVVLGGDEDAEGEIADLCRLLMNPRADFRDCQTLLLELKGTNPESIRQVALAWANSAVLRSQRDVVSKRGLAVLEAFEEPMVSCQSNLSLVTLACARIILQQ